MRVRQRVLDEAWGFGRTRSAASSSPSRPAIYDEYEAKIGALRDEMDARSAKAYDMAVRDFLIYLFHHHEIKPADDMVGIFSVLANRMATRGENTTEAFEEVIDSFKQLGGKFVPLHAKPVEKAPEEAPPPAPPAVPRAKTVPNVVAPKRKTGTSLRKDRSGVAGSRYVPGRIPAPPPPPAPAPVASMRRKDRSGVAGSRYVPGQPPGPYTSVVGRTIVSPPPAPTPVPSPKQPVLRTARPAAEPSSALPAGWGHTMHDTAHHQRAFDGVRDFMRQHFPNAMIADRELLRRAVDAEMANTISDAPHDGRFYARILHRYVADGGRFLR